MITLIAGFILCLLLSAFLSASEMAFVSVNKLKLRQRADAGNEAAKKVVWLLDHPNEFLTTILIGNNILNIAAAALLTYTLDEAFGISNEWMVTALVAPILIILGETVPKDYGRLKSMNVLLTSAGILTLLVRIFQRPAQLIMRAVDRLFDSLGWDSNKSIFVSEKEFRSLIEEGATSGALAKHEKQLIDTILDFERIHVESVMIPVDKVPKVDITETLKKVKEIARTTNSRMILVYEEIPTIIVGMIYVFDLLFEQNEAQSLKNYLRSPIFIPTSTSIEKAFLTLQERRQSFAVVTDVHGEVIGVVPIERLFTL